MLACQATASLSMLTFNNFIITQPPFQDLYKELDNFKRR